MIAAWSHGDWGTDFSDMQVSASYFDIPLKEIKLNMI